MTLDEERAKIATALYDTFNTARLSEHPEDAPQYGAYADRLRHWLQVQGLAITADTEQTKLIGTLFDAIKHGDDDHKTWLKEAIDAHFAGQPVPRPRGQGNKEKLIGELREAGSALVDKLDEARPHINNAIVIATIHLCPYAGPDCGAELDAFREALTKANPKGDGHE